MNANLRILDDNALGVWDSVWFPASELVSNAVVDSVYNEAYKVFDQFTALEENADRIIFSLISEYDFISVWGSTWDSMEYSIYHSIKTKFDDYEF